MSDLVRHTTSSPTAEDFTSGAGTPIVIDTVTGSAYVYTDGGNVASLGSGGDYAPSSLAVQTGQFRVWVKRLQLTGSSRLTLNGTARMSIYN